MFSIGCTPISHLLSKTKWRIPAVLGKIVWIDSLPVLWGQKRTSRVILS